MAMGRPGGRQGQMMVLWDERPMAPGHAFYDRRQAVLVEAGFDALVENRCQRYYAPAMGAPSLPPGHSWLSRTRARLPLEVHERVFAWALEQLAER